MHGHGEHYWDLGGGNGTYDAAANEERFKDRIPMKRDTTMLHRYASKGAANTTSGWRAWRIRVTEDNVGAWMMHCHILQHMIMGKWKIDRFVILAFRLSSINFPVAPKGCTDTYRAIDRHANRLGLR